MEDYPFHELDYLIRESGFELALVYLQDPTDPNWEAFKAGVQRDILPMISENFWRNVREIAYVEEELSEKVHQIFGNCFDLAFWDIKSQWWRASGEHKISLKSQYDHCLAIANRSVYERSELIAFVDQYEIAYEHFTHRLEVNLAGYTSMTYERPQEILPVNNDDAFLVQGRVMPTFQKAIQRDTVYDRVINRLFFELQGQGLIGQSDDLRANFRGIFNGAFREKVDWTGDIQQLTYLIRKMSGVGIHDLSIVSKRNIWIITSSCFTVRGEHCTPQQLKDTHIPRGQSIDILNQIIDELRQLILR